MKICVVSTSPFDPRMRKRLLWFSNISGEIYSCCGDDFRFVSDEGFQNRFPQIKLRTLAEGIKEKSLAIYNEAQAHAKSKGIILADTKFEFGLDNDTLILIDELLTPDSSRFWDAELYKVGQSQPSYDKQPVRDWLVQSGWNKEPPAPDLPPEVIEATTRRYREAYERLTGRKLR